MAQSKNPDDVRANRLFSGMYDFKFNFKDKNFLEVREGEVIYSRGDKSEYMYLVVNGRIKFKIYENPRQPKVYLVSKNEFFGEQELIDKAPRISSALAEKDSLLFRINHKDFIRLSSSNRRMLQNLTEKKYEEVVPATRSSELKQDIFKRIINESDSYGKDSGIEIKDYPIENPLLELKARDEITEDLKLYDEDGENFTVDDSLIDDEGVKWETVNDSEEEITEKLAEPEILEIPEIPGITEDEPKDVSAEQPEVPSEEDIMRDFLRIRSQVDTFRDSLAGTGTIEQPQPVIPIQSFIDAVIKITSGKNREETETFVTEACCEMLNADNAVLFFPDHNNVLKGRLSDGGSEIEAHEESIPSKCFRESRFIHVHDVFNDPDFNPSYDYISDFQVHSLMCTPVIIGETEKAVLEIFNSRNGEFSEAEEQLFRNIIPVISNVLSRPEISMPEEVEEEKLPEPHPEPEPEVQLEPEVQPEPEREAQPEPEPQPEHVPQPEVKIAEIPVIAKTGETQVPYDKKASFKILSEFLLREFRVVAGDLKQFNNYLQKTDIPGEAKEIADIVINEASKMVDLLEILKAFAESKNILSVEKLSYISVLDDMIMLLAEYTESRKVNLFKKLEADAFIFADQKFLYLALLQLIKYQCDLMPFGGNIFISSEIGYGKVEIILRNATRRTDESLVVSPAIEFTENTLQGLGLSLAKRIIEDHNAVIEIKNQTGTGIQIGLTFQTV